MTMRILWTTKGHYESKGDRAKKKHEVPSLLVNIAKRRARGRGLDNEWSCSSPESEVREVGCGLI